ncbi:MAG TPA: SurA N-terminal domain-containing protein [Luteolibacter sp.]|nr:SurA N-terminal domain-containing protein [Luteolibacter sp.]
MIEHIRKYSGLMVVVLGLVIVSFVLMDAQRMPGLTGDPVVMKINGRSYTHKEFQRTGASSFEVFQLFYRTGDMELFRAFAPFVMRGMGSGEEPVKQFFTGRILLKDAQARFGIHPSEDEISSRIRKMPVFSTQDGGFDAERYTTIVQKQLGRYGMTEHDLRELIADSIVSLKLQDILGSGLVADRGITASSLALDNQEVSVELASLNRETYQDKIDPKEEEIKAYWESIQDKYKTETRRKFTYVIITPEAIPEPAADAPAAPLPADATEEAKAAAKKAEEDKKAAAAAQLAEARRKALLTSNGLIDTFLVTLQDQKGAGFEDLAKKNGWEVKTTELFALSNPPAELNLDLRSSSTGGKVPQILFQIQSNGDDYSKISPAIPVGENQTVVARLESEEPSRKMTYAEARAEARADYISEKGGDALKAAVEQAATKIKESLAAKKSFADAAKDAGITEVKKIDKVSKTYRPDPLTEPQGLFDAVRSIDPGSIANTLVESERAFVAYVVKREVVKEANADARLDAEVRNQTAQNETAAFDAWLTEQIENAKVEDLYAKQ